MLDCPRFLFSTTLLHILVEEFLQPVKRNGTLSAAVIQVGMHRARNQQQFLVICVFATFCHGRVNVLPEQLTEEGILEKASGLYADRREIIGDSESETSGFTR